MTPEERQALIGDRLNKHRKTASVPPKKTTEERIDAVKPKKVKYRPRANTVLTAKPKEDQKTITYNQAITGIGINHLKGNKNE